MEASGHMALISVHQSDISTDVASRFDTPPLPLPSPQRPQNYPRIPSHLTFMVSIKSILFVSDFSYPPHTAQPSP
eukprot:scaffold7873_cov149-Isochrysis_galbana.AAC.4